MPLVLLGHPLNHPFSMMLSQNLIFVIVFTVHFHVTTWVEAGGVQPCGGRGARFARSHQSLSDARHFPIDLFNTPPSSNSQIQEPKHFPQIANASDDTFLYI